ncbi:MAG: hypothetical protein D6759_04500 [Chloroflexi bacterium]|nr:MAG: hypothetical protein D6759_04500 [Chloroflexota bacterium]
MNKRHRVLVIAGAVVIVLMLVTAAFALGVYVGEHGWTREGLTLGSPGRPGQQPAPPGGAGMPPGQPLPGGQPTLVGRIRARLDEGLELATPQGPRSVSLTSTTRFEDAQGNPIEMTALRRGDMVAIFGHFEEGGQRTLVADLIVRFPGDR